MIKKGLSEKKKGFKKEEFLSKRNAIKKEFLSKRNVIKKDDFLKRRRGLKRRVSFEKKCD